MSDESRSNIWREVWDRRDPALVEFNGFEACFTDAESYLGFVKAEAQLIMEVLRLGPEDRVLDMGCGTGLLTAMLAPRVRSVVALDYSHHALEVAQTKNGAPNVEYRWADLGALDPGDLDVDKAYAAASLHYLDGYDTVRALLAGLWQRGIGLLVLDLPDAAYQSAVTRPYDAVRWSHATFDETQVLADFPAGRVLRGRFPEYSNDAVRFSLHLPPHQG